VEDLVRNKLYADKDPMVRKSLVSTFIEKEGVLSRDGILLQLFDDLDLQEADEQGRLSPPLNGKYSARACLVEVFNFPKDVKSKDRPFIMPTENCTQARFIDVVAFFPSPKIDAVVRKVLHATDEDYLARSCIRYLVGRGADDDIRKYVTKRLSGADEEHRKKLERLEEQLGWTPLHVAADMSEEGRIDDILRKGVDINARATNGQTALHIAAQGRFGVIRVLLERKAELNIRDSQGRTPVQLAMDYEDAVEMLLAGGAAIPDILIAAFAGRADLASGFLEKDKSAVKLRSYSGDTPLHVASRRGHLKVAEVLLANGAEVNATDNSSSKLTPLHWAAIHGHREVVALLLAHGANQSLKSWDNKTALDHARENGDAGTIQLLEKRK
jgi:ankyrin repeat protein